MGFLLSQEEENKIKAVGVVLKKMPRRATCCCFFF
jgi:hypothetical protein